VSPVLEINWSLERIEKSGNVDSPTVHQVILALRFTNILVFKGLYRGGGKGHPPPAILMHYLKTDRIVDEK